MASISNGYYAIHSYWVISSNELKFLCGLSVYENLHSKLKNMMDHEPVDKGLALDTLIFKHLAELKEGKITIQNTLHFILTQLNECSSDVFHFQKPILCHKCNVIIEEYKYQPNSYKFAIVPKEVQ